MTAHDTRRRRSRQLAPAAAALAAAALCATAAPAHGAFPGDNGRIAYSTTSIDDDDFTSGPTAQIHAVAPAAGLPEALTPAGADASDPAYSPDGRWIVHVRRPRPTADTEIYRMRADGSRVRRLTRNGVDDGSPAWSADGRRIVFVRSTAKSKELFTMRRDGRRVRRLTRNGLVEEAPAWSPDGRWIAFMRQDRLRGRTAIYRMRPNGRRVRLVTGGEFPSWAPDGSRIAFNRHTRDPGLREIFTVRPNGRGARRVTDDLLDDIRPAWSPDGRWIAFQRDVTKLARVPAGGGDVQILVTAEAPSEGFETYGLLGYPSWQPR